MGVQFSGRFTHGFVAVDVRVLGMGLSGNEMLVYLHILRRAVGRKSRGCFESQDAIGTYLGLSRKTVNQAVLALRERGLITMTHNPGQTLIINVVDVDELVPEQYRIGGIVDQFEEDTYRKRAEGKGGGLGKIYTPPGKNLHTPCVKFTHPSHSIDQLDPLNQIQNTDPDLRTSDPLQPTPSEPPPESGAEAPHRPAGRRVRSGPKIEVNDNDKALGKAWVDWALARCPTLVNATPSSFAKAIAEVRTKTKLGDAQIKQLFEFVKNDHFWQANAVSPKSLLKYGTNGLRKVDNIVTCMNGKPNRAMVSNEEAEKKAKAREEIEAARARIAARRAAERAAASGGDR